MYTFTGQKKPYLIFLHGFMGTSSDWNHIIEKLISRFNCVSLNLPYHSNNTDNCTLNQWPDYLLKQLPFNSNITLIGYSLGGRLASIFAAKFPKKIKQLILISSHLGLNNDIEKKCRIKDDQNNALLIKNDLNFFLKNWYKKDLWGELSQNEKTNLIAKRINQDKNKLATALKEFSLGKQDYLAPKLTEIPITYITGENDKKYTLLGQNYGKKFKNINHQILKNSGHNCLLAPEKLYLIIKTSLEYHS